MSTVSEDAWHFTTLPLARLERHAAYQRDDRHAFPYPHFIEGLARQPGAQDLFTDPQSQLDGGVVAGHPADLSTLAPSWLR